MASTSGTTTPSLSDHPAVAALLREPRAHDFFAVVRQLQAALKMPEVGTVRRPRDEPVRFGQDASLAFAPTSVVAARVTGEGGRLEVDLAFTGLLGPNGPMPAHVTEWVIDRKRHHGDRAIEAFLNLFHHRVYSLFYRAWALNQPTADLDRGEGGRHAFYLKSLCGIGTEGSSGRDTVPDWARIHYSGWLASLGRSPEGLASILGDFLQVPVVVQGFQGQWLRLPEEAQCRMGGRRQGAVLGHDCHAGEQVRVSHLKFRLRIGPLDRRTYESLLPGGRAFAQVRDWVRFYVGEELFWEVQLVLKRPEVPECRAGGGVRLGWTTWMGKPPPDRDVDDLILQAA